MERSLPKRAGIPTGPGQQPAEPGAWRPSPSTAGQTVTPLGTAGPLVLIIDDDTSTRRLLQLELEPQGFRVILAGSGAEGLRLVEAQAPDVVLMDILMPGLNGLEAMHQLKARSNIPVLLITGLDAQSEKVRGLDLGADDYIVKPFSPEEVAARIRAVLRRGPVPSNDPPVVQASGLTIDLSRHMGLRDGKAVRLSKHEWLLLEHFAKNAGKVLTNNALLGSLRDERERDITDLRVWVYRLRKQIERDPAHPRIIKTVPGVGYILEPDPPG